MLLMTQALALMEKSTSRANRVACSGPFRMDTGQANSMDMASTDPSSHISVSESLATPSPTLLVLLLLLLT